jgi:hypothetical protein
MTPKRAPTIAALAAREVDLGHDTPAYKLLRPFANLTYEFMARHAAKSHIALEDLKVGRTNPGKPDADQRGPGVNLRRRIRRLQL